MTVADDAKLVKAYILDHKWVPHYPTEGGKCCCLVTASVAISRLGGFLQHEELLNAMRDLIPKNYDRGLGAWNDAQTSVEPVLALLDKVIAGGGDE